MVRISFTPALQRHVHCPDVLAAPGMLRDVLQQAFDSHPRLRSYVLDEQDRLRHHVVVFIDGSPAVDRIHLTTPVAEGSEVFVMQALSGG